LVQRGFVILPRPFIRDLRFLAAVVVAFIFSYCSNDAYVRFIMGWMTESEKDPIAQAMVQKRWDKTSAKKRSEIGKGLAAARWAGHVAKRPSSSRKPAAKKGKAAK
jgi:hypothetical protein